MTAEEECLDALNLQKKNQMTKNLNAERNPCISLFDGMWERVAESRVGLQDVNVTNRESTKRGHMRQRTLAKDVQLLSESAHDLRNAGGNAAGGGGVREVKTNPDARGKHNLGNGTSQAAKALQRALRIPSQKNQKFSQTFLLQTSTVL